MSKEFETIVLEKLDCLNQKIEKLDAKVDGVNDSLSKRIDELDKKLNAKIDGVNDNLNKKIDYVDKKQTERSDSIMAKLEYTNNNIAKILEEQIKMKEEIKKYNTKNEKEHRLFEYEINNLKRHVV